MEILETLKSEFNNHVSFRSKRPGIVQVLAPLFHEDGDMLDIFIDLPADPSKPIRISDHGLTLMRLSYSYELDTPTKQKVFTKIITENGVSEDRGRLYIETKPEGVYPALLQFAQTVAKVNNLQAFKREVVQNLFYEMLDDFIKSTLLRFRPQPHYSPIPERDDLEVDWFFDVSPRPIFLYGARDNAKARLTALYCLEYQRNSVPFRSIVVHEDFENGLSRKDQARITSAVDKQFTSLADFKTNGESYFVRETQQIIIH